VNDRIHKNVARLYARRVLEIAVASAAVQRFIAELENPAAAAAAATKPPIDWQNWQRREWSQELLESLGGNKVTRLWVATKRLVSLTCLAAPLTVLYPLSLISNKAEEISWRYALWGIEHAGPTFIKLVQWASTRQDLFSPEFCHYFGKLQDETKGHSWEETLAILQEELGLPELENSQEGWTTAVNEYLDLNHTPIGSGCVAQVYRGKLKQAVGQYDKGTEIAVKVQHPGIWHKVCVDFYILGLAARWLEGLPLLNLKYLSLSDSVRKFRDIMLPQLDLTLESKHLQRFNRDFANSSEVTFPRPINDLTSTRVLTETFQHGKPILQYTNAPEAERKEIAYNGLETTLKMIFLNDFLHGTFACTKFQRAIGSTDSLFHVIISSNHTQAICILEIFW
jgi:aarF domain-containing kinase